MAGWGGTLESGGGGGGGGPGPVVQNFQPPKGTEIQPGTPLTFDVIFSSTIVAIVISIVYEQTGATEIVYDDNGFTTNFAPTGGFLGSERQTIVGGWHFILRRRGGWPLAPTVLVEGADENGGRITEA